MINISGLDNSVFAPQAPITGDNTNFAKNLSAIINPTQALEQKQNEQIAKSVADLQMSSIYPKIQQKFLEAREKYISDYKDALKSHKGMGRLKLTPQEQLNFDRRKADMQNYVAWGKGATASLDKVNQDVIAALKAGEIEPGAYEKWFNGYMDEITKSKNGGDVPNAYSHFINANLIHPKVKPEDVMKQVNEKKTFEHGFWEDLLEGQNNQDKFNEDAVKRIIATKDPKEKSLMGQTDEQLLQGAKDRWKKRNEDSLWLGWAKFNDQQKREAAKDALKEGKVKEIPYDNGWDFNDLQAADRPKYSGYAKDGEGNNTMVKNAEITNVHIEGGKYVGTIVGEGVALSGDNAGKKVPLPEGTKVQVNDKQIEDALKEKGFIRTFNNEPYIVPKKSSTTPEPAKTTEKTAKDYNL